MCHFDNGVMNLTKIFDGSWVWNLSRVSLEDGGGRVEGSLPIQAIWVRI